MEFPPSFSQTANFIHYTTGEIFVKQRPKFTKIFYDYIEKLCGIRYNSCKYNY